MTLSPTRMEGRNSVLHLVVILSETGITSLTIQPCPTPAAGLPGPTWSLWVLLQSAAACEQHLRLPGQQHVPGFVLHPIVLPTLITVSCLQGSIVPVESLWPALGPCQEIQRKRGSYHGNRAGRRRPISRRDKSGIPVGPLSMLQDPQYPTPPHLRAVTDTVDLYIYYNSGQVVFPNKTGIVQ